MKKIFLLFLVIGFLSSCTAQKIKQQSNNNKKMMPIIDKNFEMFDSITYNRLYKLNPYYQSEFLENGNYIKMNKSEAMLSYSIINKDSFFSLSKGYYVNGKIKLKGFMFNNRTFQKGTWYEFDESGRLIRETNYDQFYDFTFEDIVRFCEKENIPLPKGPILQSTGFHTDITRGHSAILNDSSWWKIEWLKKPNVIEIITLDGKTGKVLKRQDIDYINN